MVEQTQSDLPVDEGRSGADGPQKNALSETNGALERLRLQSPEASKVSMLPNKSVPPPGSILTGKQEHCMIHLPCMTLVIVIII